MTDLEMKILYHLEEIPRTKNELASALGESYVLIHEAVSRLNHRGDVMLIWEDDSQYIQKPVWHLTEEGWMRINEESAVA